MKPISTPEAYKKERSRYGTLASMPIICAIFHLIALVFLQTTLNYTEENGYTNLYALSLPFGASSFTTIVSSATYDLKIVRSLPAVIGALIGIAMILLSSAAIRGKKKCLLYAFLLYVLDTLFLIPSIVLSALKVYPISFTGVDIALSITFHVIFLFFLGWAVYSGKRLSDYEEKKRTEENSIHTTGVNR